MGPGKPGSSKRARGGPLAIARSFGPPGLAPGIPGTPLPALIYIYMVLGSLFVNPSRYHNP